MHADNATKEIVRATPTTNAAGQVIKWEMHVRYTLNDHELTFPYLTEQKVPVAGTDPIQYREIFPLKKIIEFTKAELLTIVGDYFNEEFDRQYGHEHNNEECCETEFDVNTLS